jgi:cation diffusion facilitator family transporter
MGGPVPRAGPLTRPTYRVPPTASHLPRPIYDAAVAGQGHGTRAIVAAFFANLGIAIAKFIGFVITTSTSMLAEAVHSLADTGNQALLLLGGRRARKEATAEFPFGYGRERYFWSFVVALVLFSLGSLFAIYEGVHKLDHPEPLESPAVAYTILGVAIVLEAFSLRTAVVESRVAKQSLTWRQFLRKAKTPELPVVLLEDIGAMCGLFIALGAISLSEATGEPKWDGYGTLLIGGLLGVIAIFLAIEMKGLLIGEAASDEMQDAIKTAIEGDPAVNRLIHFRTQHLGPEELLIAGKVEFARDLDTSDLAEAVNRIETSVRASLPISAIIYLEPDLAREQVPTS